MDALFLSLVSQTISAVLHGLLLQGGFESVVWTWGGARGAGKGKGQDGGRMLLGLGFLGTGWGLWGPHPC